MALDTGRARECWSMRLERNHAIGTHMLSEMLTRWQPHTAGLSPVWGRERDNPFLVAQTDTVQWGVPWGPNHRVVRGQRKIMPWEARSKNWGDGAPSCGTGGCRRAQSNCHPCASAEFDSQRNERLWFRVHVLGH